MKRLIFLLFTLSLFLFSACGKAPGDSAGHTGTTDTLDSTRFTLHPEDHNQHNFVTSFVETQEGYFYGHTEGEFGSSSRSLIYFCSRGEDTFVPLCGKPNCSHHDENCNAWFGDGQAECFGYYNGALYAAAFDWDKYLVYRINLDGTGHERVAEVDLSKLDEYSSVPAFHHGKLIVCCEAPQTLPAEEREDHVIVMDLSDYSQKEIGMDYLQEARLPGPLRWFYKDKAYELATGDKRLDHAASEKKLTELDLTTGEVREALQRPVTGLYMTDATWYFFERDLSRSDPKSEETAPGFREYDVASGSIKECGLPVEDIIAAYYDDNYIYACGDYKNDTYSLYILSRDYKLLNTIELREDMDVVAIASDRVYFFENYSFNFDFYLDKSEIGSHNLELKPVKHAG